MINWKMPAIGLVVLFLSYLILAAVAPSSLQIERSVRVSVAPDVVFGHVACLNRWDSWSSWKRFDPSFRNEYSKKACGTGAWQKWSGKQSGRGKRTVVDLKANQYLKFEVFHDDLAQSGVSEFYFREDCGDSFVTWKFGTTKCAFLERPINLFGQTILEEMIEKGLASLKLLAENELVAFKLYDYLVEVDEIIIQDQLFLMEISEVNVEDIDAYEDAGADNILKYMAENNIEASGPKTMLMLNNKDTVFTLAMAFPIPEEVVVSEPFICKVISGGPGYQVVYDRSDMSSNVSQLARRSIRSFMLDNGLSYNLPIRNVYQEKVNLNDSLESSVKVIFQVKQGGVN
jgi:hypothetical protein